VHTSTITSDRPLAVAGSDHAAGGLFAIVKGHTQPTEGANSFRRMTGLLEDAVLLMLIVFLFPLVILLVGAPIALCVRAVIEIVNRF
jgi:hypothetical protein